MNRPSSNAIIIFLIILMTANITLAQSKGGFWQFENNGDDSADWDAIANSGTIQSNAFYENSNPAYVGSYYLNLDSAYSHVKISDSDDLDFNDENIGISAWIYAKQSGNKVYFILNKGQQDSNPKTSNYALRLGKSGKLEFLIRDANNKAQPVASSFLIEPNVWTFIAVYYDYSLKKVYFWNAATQNPVDTMDYDYNYFDNADPFTIGGWYTSDPGKPVSNHFAGYIDDVRISGRREDIIPTSYTDINSNDHQRQAMIPMQMDIYPNPVTSFKNSATISIVADGNQLRNSSIQIYNLLGQRIKDYTIVEFANQHIMHWNVKNRVGNIVPAGIYFVKFQSGNRQLTKRVTVVR